MIQRQEIPLLLTGFMATLSGVGLARFAYTALMPQMVPLATLVERVVPFAGEPAAVPVSSFQSNVAAIV